MGQLKEYQHLLACIRKYEREAESLSFNQRRTFLRTAFNDAMFATGYEDYIEGVVVAKLKEEMPNFEAVGFSIRPTLSSLKQHMSNQALHGFLLWSVELYAHNEEFVKESTADYLVHVIRVMVDPSHGATWKGKESRGLTVAARKRLKNPSRLRELSEWMREKEMSVGEVKVPAITKEKEGKTMTTTTAMKIDLSEGHKNAVNALLALDCGLSLDDINGRFAELNDKLNEAKAEAESARAMAASASAIVLPKHVEGTGEVPSGDVEMKSAWEVFGEHLDDGFEKLFSFDVPVFKWEGVHPDVPMVDESYKYDPLVLFRVLQGLVGRDNTYLYGHTGTGKSTMVEQTCARLAYPLVRVNFDSEISRMDLVGRDTLVSVDGVTESKFVDGVVPDALARPCVLLCDEVDFIRPDVMYVFQRVLEGNGLLITEDGGRKVVPDPMFRLIATANTVGQGDDTSMYQGARPQSMATLDRFENWAEMKYMKAAVEEKWLRNVTPGLLTADAKKFVEYAAEHREAFTSGKVLQPLSPRGLRAMAKRFVVANGLTGDKSGAMKEAMQSTVLDRCTKQDKAVLDGLVQRVVRA